MFEALTNSHIAVTGRSVTLGVPSTLAHAQLTLEADQGSHPN